MFGFQTSQGQLGLLLADGRIIKRSIDGSVTTSATVPTGFRVNPTGEVYELGPDTLAIAYVGQGGVAPAGVAVVDERTGQVQKTVPLASAQYVVPHSGVLIALKTDETLVSVDLTAGVVNAQAGHASTGAQALVP